ncbi:MAG TPA: hypothetical protein VFG10_15485 [Saprospiraceae bacterium]|nr:hypothetical protein [Saprospiraceae bacterium]
MKYNFILGIAILTFTITGLSSCDKKGDCGFGNETEYIVFGHFYGECGGEGCVEIFKVDGNSLFEDTLDMYPGSSDFYPGQFATKWSAEKFDLVKDLKSFFPESLMDETEIVQGQPDAGDWGGIYFEIQRGTTHRFWLLDQLETNMPSEYNEFVDRINEKIAIIHQ